MSQVAQLLRSRKYDVISTIMLDTGKVFVEADHETAESIDTVEYYISRLEKMVLLKDISWQAKGITIVASNWEHAFANAIDGITSALITGNSVIFKPSPLAALSGWVLSNIFWDSGIDKNTLQFFQNHFMFNGGRAGT